MTQINNPGEAMRAVAAILRHEGYGIEELRSVESSDFGWFQVDGQICSLTEGTLLGRITARVAQGGWCRITGGAFGEIVEDPIAGTKVDPFVGL